MNIDRERNLTAIIVAGANGFPLPAVSAPKIGEGLAMGEVKLQRGHCDIAILNHLKVRIMAGRVHHSMKPKPIIVVAARIRALDDRTAAIVMEPLPGDFDALNILRQQRRKVDIGQRARRMRRRGRLASMRASSRRASSR